MSTSTEHRKPRRLTDFPYRGQYRYFITIRTHSLRHYFSKHEVVTMMIQILKNTAEQENFGIWAYCFMPDHVHLLIEGKKANADMRRFVALFKQKTGYWFSRIYCDKLWDQNYYEHVLQDNEAIIPIARYIFRNPVRKGIVEDYSLYPYSGSFELENINEL